MNEEPEKKGNGFVWRIRLGEILNMCIVMFAAVSLGFQILGTYNALADKLSSKYDAMLERISKVEAKLDATLEQQKHR